MVSALDRKLLRDLLRLKGQVFTIAVVVACGIASYVSLRSTWTSLGNSKSSYFAEYRFADVFATLRRAPDSVALRLEDLPGVARVYARIVRRVTVPMEDMAEPASGILVSLPPSSRPPLNGVFLRSGRFPFPSRDDEAVVLEPFAAAHELVAGDHIPVVINGKLRRVRIVGIGLSPEFVFAADVGDFSPDDRRIAILWMDRGVLAPAFQMDGAFNDVAIRLQPGASEAAVLSGVDTLLEPYGGLGAVGRDKQLSNFLLEGELRGLEAMATVVPAIFLAVAAFLLNIVLSRLVLLQRQQIAALKALGYSNRVISFHYLKLLTVIVLLGSVLGIALGAYFGSALTDVYGRYFRFPVLHYRLDPAVVVTGVGVSFAAAVVGALVSVRHVARLSPAEAMRPPAPLRYTRGLIDRLPIERIFGTSVMMVAREIRRRPVRLLLSSVGIAAAIGIMVVGRFGYDSVEHLMDVLYHREQRGDVTVVLLEPQQRSVERVLRQVPGVLDAQGERMVPVRFRAGQRWRDSVINGIPEDPRLRLITDRNAREIPVPHKGIALSRKLAEILDVDVGSELQVEIREGNRAHVRVGIVALVDDAFGLQGYMKLSELHRHLRQEETVSVVHLRVDATLEGETDRRLRDMPTVARVIKTDTVVERFNDQSAQSMWVMTLILSIFGAAIAVGVVYNNARVSLSMRSRDLSSLRVLGFSRAEISSILLGELAIQVLIAIPVGLVLGTYWSHAVMATNDPEVYRFAIVISARSYAYATAIALAAAVVSALLVRRKLDRLDLIAVLKTRE